MLGVMKLKFVTTPCCAFATGAGNQRREVGRALACSVDRIAAGKLHTPGEVSNKQCPRCVAVNVGNFVVSELELELAVLPERDQVALVTIEGLLRLHSYIIVRPEEIVERGIEFADEEPVAQIAIFFIFRSP